MTLKLDLINIYYYGQNKSRDGQLLALILVLTAMLTSCSESEKKAETILMNGKIITVDSTFSIAEAIAISNGTILKVGNNETIRKMAGDSTKIIDLRGHSVIPGLIDNHVHPIEASQSEFFEPIPDVHTIEDVLKWVSDQASTKADNEWIIHPKFFITRINDMRQLTKKELDSVAPENPVFLDGSFGGIINSKAIAVSHLRDSNHPGILRDEKTGVPTGVILRSAFPLLAIPKPAALTDEQKAELLKTQFHLYNSIGLTSICSGGGTVDDLKAYEALRERAGMTIRVFHNIIVPFDLRKSPAEMADELKQLEMKTEDGDEWVKVGALKVVLDGGILTGTAFLNEGWGGQAREIYGIKDASYRGELFYSKKQLTTVIAAALDAGWKFAAHVTGGGGVDTLLAAYEAINRQQSIQQKRFSIIHGNFFTPEAIEKMTTLGVCADMQPAWFFKDTDLLYAVLGDERMRNFHPYHALKDAGVIVNGGSDHMVKLDPDLSINPYNPFTSMWSVVTRKTERETVLNPEQKVSREEALKMYTINNAYASFEESIKGSLEAGKFADLVVLSEDILTCSEDAIRKIRPLLTMVNGKIVFNSGVIQVGPKG